MYKSETYIDTLVYVCDMYSRLRNFKNTYRLLAHYKYFVLDARDMKKPFSFVLLWEKAEHMCLTQTHSCCACIAQL